MKFQEGKHGTPVQLQCGSSLFSIPEFESTTWNENNTRRRRGDSSHQNARESSAIRRQQRCVIRPTAQMPCSADVRQSYGSAETLRISSHTQSDRTRGDIVETPKSSLKPVRPTSINIISSKQLHGVHARNDEDHVIDKTTLDYAMSTKQHNNVGGDLGHVDALSNGKKNVNSAQEENQQHVSQSDSLVMKERSYKHGGSLKTVDEEEDPSQTSTRSKPMTRSFSSFDIPNAESNRMKRRGRGSLQMAFSQTVKLFKTVRHGSKSSPSTPIRSSPSLTKWDDTTSWAGSSTSDKNDAHKESFYKSYEDLAIAQSPLSPRDSPDGITTLNNSTSYGGDVWRDVSSSGGVVRISGTDVSLHINACEKCVECSCNGLQSNSKLRERAGSLSGARLENKRNSSNKKRNASSSSYTGSTFSSSVRDFTCPGPDDFDGRIVLGLEDPPDTKTLAGADFKDGCKVEPQQIAHAGPAVRMDFVDSKMCQHEATLQLSTNLKISPGFIDEFQTNGDKSMQAFVMTCLQSNSLDGPFCEVKACFQFGDTLQATLDLGNEQQNTNDSFTLYVVPVMKVCFHYALSDLIGLKTLGVGVYGPKHIYFESICCVSISPTGFVPPFLTVTHGTKKLNLLRWNSFKMPMQLVQGFGIEVQTPQLSSLSVDTSGWNCTISTEDINTAVRINHNFVIRITDNDPTPVSPKSKFGLTLMLTGNEDRRERKVKLDPPALRDNNLSPYKAITRFNKAGLSVKHAHLAHCDFVRQWHLLQLVDKSMLKGRSVPGSARRLCPLRLAITQRRSDKWRQGIPSPHMLSYDQADYLVVISDKTLVINDREKSFECLLAYAKHKSGLVQTNHVRHIDFDEFYDWNKARPSVKSVVEAVTEPLQHFNFSFPRIQKKLLERDIAWQPVMESIQYGRSFVLKAVSAETASSTKINMLAHFFSKYKEYCSSGPRLKSPCQEIIKALLYAEEYELVNELVIDGCLFSVALAIANRWSALAQKLGYGNNKVGDTTKQSIADKLDPWKGAWRFLTTWKNNHPDNYLALIRLYSALDEMNDFPKKVVSCVTASIILVSSVDVLRCYDTRL
uniref:SH3 domain-binding protein 4-like n=1 Tax=Phallusia mammillata TaxID=59560 RepID=A0A6F9DRH1_9ASCI|nr:SH3 domain-binding protein 4-like [Phallusia mammillata]